MDGPAVRYPANTITPAGSYYLRSGRYPMVVYRSYNDEVVFHLSGPLAIADPSNPDSVTLTSMKGLVPPWQNIKQKGATQDGSSYVTSLYDELEVDMEVTVRGKDPNRMRQVLRAWIDSWDAKQPGELSWWTPEHGRWWAPVRWSRNPVDQVTTFNRQKFQWPAVAYDAFWRSYDSTDVFAFKYQTDYDDFSYDTYDDGDLGDGWELAYTGGTGFMFADGQAASSTLNGGRVAVARRVGYTFGADSQIVSVIFGRIPSWGNVSAAHNDIWLRMANTGTPGLTGVRLRYSYRHLRLSYFVDGVETLLRETSVTIPFQPNDQLLIGAGFEENPRKFIVLRGVTNSKGQRTAVNTLMTVVESGTGSPMGADYRSAGFGMQANNGDMPIEVQDWSAGVNQTTSQWGFVTRINTGDQPMWDRYTLIGPGYFGIGNGPNSTDLVRFGPLLEGQIVQIRTDPRKRGVVDLTSQPPTPQQQAEWANARRDLEIFLTQGMPTPATSVFGVAAPQGNLYKLMQGRFSEPIPAKPPGQLAVPYKVRVAIDDGNANSAILAAGTPLRRHPD